MSSSVYDAPAPPGLSSTFTATGAPFQNDGLRGANRIPEQCNSGLSMRTHHSTRPTCQFGTHERSRRTRRDAAVRRVRPRPPGGRSAASPSSRSRARIWPDSMRARVAQAGWSTATTSARPSTRSGRRCAAELGADQLLPAGEDGLHGRRGGGRAEAAEQPGHRFADRARAAAGAARHRSTSVSTAHDPGHLDPLGQRRGRREERLAGRQLGHQGPAPGRVELGEHVVEEQRRHQGGPGADQLVDAQAQGQRQAALLALGGVGPGLPALDRQAQVVAVRAHGVDAPAQVVACGWRPSASSRSPSQLRS